MFEDTKILASVPELPSRYGTGNHPSNSTARMPLNIQDLETSNQFSYDKEGPQTGLGQVSVPRLKNDPSDLAHHGPTLAEWGDKTFDTEEV